MYRVKLSANQFQHHLVVSPTQKWTEGNKYDKIMMVLMIIMWDNDDNYDDNYDDGDDNNSDGDDDNDNNSKMIMIVILITIAILMI